MQRTVVASTLLSLFLAACSDHAAMLEAARSGPRPPAPPAGVDNTERAVQSVPAGSITTPPAVPPPPAMTPPQPAGACMPNAAAVYPAPWRPPSGIRQAVCTANEIAAIVDCYVGNSPLACNAGVSPYCAACLVSDAATSAAYGAIVVDAQRPDGVQVNVEGCVAAISGDVSPYGCGPKVAMAEQCKEQACAQCADASQQMACQQAASMGACAQYQAAENACGHFLAQCWPQGASPAQIAMQIGQLFCM